MCKTESRPVIVMIFSKKLITVYIKLCKHITGFFSLKRKKNSICRDWNIRNLSVSCLLSHAESKKSCVLKEALNRLKEVLFPWTCQSLSLFIRSLTRRLQFHLKSQRTSLNGLSIHFLIVWKIKNHQSAWIYLQFKQFFFPF